MTSLEKLDRLEERLRALIAERDRWKSGAEAPEAAQDRARTRRVNDLLREERKAIRARVESLLSAISRSGKAG